jgi:hypothetical protein
MTRRHRTACDECSSKPAPSKTTRHMACLGVQDTGPEKASHVDAAKALARSTADTDGEW